ncbi:MAG: putative PurR-regulated permease PerM [Saprospiraceae bacterium]|jgi:predicted PurR-regulated permease PerM
MELHELKTIKRILTIMVIPVILYALKLLSFIFIPLFFALFFGLLFSPILRWLTRKNIPKTGSLTIITVIVVIGFILIFKVGQLAGSEITAADQNFWNVAAIKIDKLIISAEEILGIQLRGSNFKTIVQNKQVSQAIQNSFGSTLKLFQTTFTMSLMTIFFLVLLLSGSMNFQKVMQDTLFNSRLSSLKTFLTIERSIVTFIKVKSITSLFTGLGFGLTAYFFDVSFPLFWGLLAFLLNYIQLLGSVIVTVLLVIFAVVEINTVGSLVLFALILIIVQLAFGSVLEPILMGQSFKINTIAVLVMLMFWGYLWGVPGLVLSIPITVILKTILEQFPNTKLIAKILS